MHIRQHSCRIPNPSVSARVCVCVAVQNLFFSPRQRCKKTQIQSIKCECICHKSAQKKTQHQQNRNARVGDPAGSHFYVYVFLFCFFFTLEPRDDRMQDKWWGVAAVSAASGGSGGRWRCCQRGATETDPLSQQHAHTYTDTHTLELALAFDLGHLTAELRGLCPCFCGCSFFLASHLQSAKKKKT